MGEGLAMTMLGEAFTPPSTSHLVWFAVSRYQMEVVVEWDGWERSTSAANGAKSLLSHSVPTAHVQVVTPPTVNLV